MSKKDQEKWDRKYLENPRLREKRPPLRWIASHVGSGEGKRALDLACGTGRNAIALAEKGWRVEAVDLSPLALQILTEHAEEAGVREAIDTELIDLDKFDPEEKRYDLILMANYLDRGLIARLIPALKGEGLFIVETYMEHPDNEKKEANPDYLLKTGELGRIFAEGFEILAYEEFWNEGVEMYRMRKAGIVARKMADKR
jgi:SAM-dependent methyltransferase